MRNVLIQSVFNMVFRISPDRRKLIRKECEQNVKTEALVGSLCKAVQEATKCFQTIFRAGLDATFANFKSVFLNRNQSIRGIQVEICINLP